MFGRLLLQELFKHPGAPEVFGRLPCVFFLWVIDPLNKPFGGPGMLVPASTLDSLHDELTGAQAAAAAGAASIVVAIGGAITFGAVADDDRLSYHGLLRGVVFTCCM